MKVLHIIPSLRLGGAPKLIASLLPLLNKGNNDADLLVFKEADSPLTYILKNKGVRIKALNINTKNPLSIFKLCKEIKGYDIVHVHLVYPLYFTAIASLFQKAKLVYTEHSTYNRRREYKILRPLERFIYSKYKAVISISRQTEEALLSWLANRNTKTYYAVINNGIDLSEFENHPTEKDNNRLIMVSRFAPSKDQITAIRSMAYIDDRFHLYLVGDGEMRRRCEEAVLSSGLQKRVHFLGSRADIPQLISSSFIGIQSSNWEGFGLSAVEIMACGIPVIASDVDGLKQVVEGAGLLFEKGNAKNLAAKIASIADNIDLYNSISERCKKRAAEYSIDIMAARYLEVYAKLINKVLN